MSTNGGTSYALVDESYISNKPFLTSYTITGLTLQGSVYYFKLEVNNEVGSSKSLPVAIVLAVVPEKPISAPTQDYTETTKKRIKVLYSALTGT